MAVLYWLKRPRMGLSRVRYFLWEKLNPDKPWLCPGTIDFCSKHLTVSMKGLEFGSGRSTRWFSTMLGQLISVEHEAQWYSQVQEQLKSGNVSNVDYRLVPLNHPESEPEHAQYDPTPDYVAIADSQPDRSLDFALVDGHYRTTCVRHLISKMALGGFLIVDDINMWPSPESLPIPKNWKVVDDSSNGVKRCIVWQAA